ncbi:type II secretion system protein E [Dissulfurispira thermophila]|uniref:Type II secretion system protein E n=1 Tax=Dissulfurispira thermophila TaxID=2715679 RepID=A0A7G1H476_9BACT|nr:GspE/PulE family protein [Dissulfurispira thermophila]BCB96537.1 type II secretion system protein E [Dissulfurispira thermophila]
MRKKLGEILIESGLITEEELKHALTVQKIKKQKIGKILIELGFVTNEQIAETLAEKLNLQLVYCADHKIPDALKKLIPKDFAKDNLVFPIGKKDNTLILAMADPLDYRTIDAISFREHLRVLPVISYYWAILRAIEQNYVEDENVFDVFSANITADKDVKFIEEKGSDIDNANIEVLYLKSKSPPIVKLVAMIIAEAAKAMASDIHIEPREKYVQVKFRIDGELRNIFKYDKNIHDSVISRVKIISNLNITNRRLPQDGSAHVSFHGKEIDLRISTLPSLYGETIVIRLLDQSIGIIPLEKLAMPEHIRNPIIEIVERPQGMFIVTGPTGSGKTTTLYACLSQLRSESKKVVTIEDPVEYKLEGITQIPVNESIGLTFASVLRSVLRQDPDIIKIGEIRDIETAEIAIKASLTGHFVLTTLHTNNTVATITRLINLGIPAYLISSAVSAILAQRLVRKICNHCKVESEITEELLSFMETHNLPVIGKHYHGTGCQKCSNTGYSGRIAVYEYIQMSPALRKLVANNTSESSLLMAAKNEGVTFLFEDAWNKVRDGITTAHEVIAKVPVT